MNSNILEKLNNIRSRSQEINKKLESPDVLNDIKEYTKLQKEYSDISEVVGLYNEYKQVELDLSTAEEMLQDPDYKDMAYEEIGICKNRLEELVEEIQKNLIPKDANDNKSVFLEIRAGTGGDESAIFVGDLFRMYSRYAETNNWKVEIISTAPSELGGYKEIIANIIGNGVYSKLKFESGTHRVQRVPQTESQGRVHTSACTIAVLPESDEVGEVVINPADIRIDTFRASGAGGQHINKTDSAIRITHMPTGIVVECQDDRSQHRNKAQAMKVLSARIRDQQVQQQQKETAATRKSMVGSGDRSERIRTYNFPQNRLTDHRINLTLYKLEYIMEGDLDELITALATQHQLDMLEQEG